MALWQADHHKTPSSHLHLGLWGFWRGGLQQRIRPTKMSPSDSSFKVLSPSLPQSTCNLLLLLITLRYSRLFWGRPQSLAGRYYPRWDTTSSSWYVIATPPSLVFCCGLRSSGAWWHDVGCRDCQSADIDEKEIRRHTPEELVMVLAEAKVRYNALILSIQNKGLVYLTIIFG
ncbi:hypothetical protein GW17_00037903 [Ensete ventricosum]|nr:hypothetical protein GW17_00037903 [Ensete ventricosum]